MKKILAIMSIFTIVNWSLFASEKEGSLIHCDIESTCLMRTSECIYKYPDRVTVIILSTKEWENNYVIRLERWQKKHICIANSNGQFNTTTYNTYENKQYNYNQYSTLSDCKRDLAHQLDINGCTNTN